MRHRAGVQLPEQAAVSVSVEWRSTAVTTDPPRSAEHLEWEARFTLAAPEALRVAALVEHGGETQWALGAHEPARKLELSATFSPWRWRTSDAVQIGFEGRRLRVDDRALKQDARNVAVVTAPGRALTGEVVHVLALPGHGIALAFIALAEGDTEERRLGRWRVTPAAVERLPAYLAPLASGYQTGTLIGPAPA
jgi:hypothetical protein